MKFKPSEIQSMVTQDFIARMVVETMKLLKAYGGEVEYSYLLGVVSHLVLNSLKKVPEQPCGNKELYEFTKRSLLEAKLDIQEAIALGFGEAMNLYSGKDLLYYCQIKAAEEPKGVTH